MPVYKFRAIQVIIDDFGKWVVTDKAIKEEFDVVANSSSEAINIGCKSIEAMHPEVPLSWFLTGASSL